MTDNEKTCYFCLIDRRVSRQQTAISSTTADAEEL